MTTYKGINGFAVQSVASDPSPSDEGQVWYNNATYVFKLSAATTTDAWASGGNLNTARAQLKGAGSSQNDSLVFGGTLGVPVISAASEAYNGTAWTNTPSMNTAKMGFYGCGNTQTAALAFGGITNPYVNVTAASESWNGTSWTNTPSLNTAKRNTDGFGTNTAAIVTGGSQAPGAQFFATESWNGSTWTNIPATIPISNAGCSFGTQTAGIMAGAGPALNQTLSFNGSAWTTSPALLNTARVGAVPAGTQTAGLIAGGNISPPPFNSNATESWNGSSWTSLTNMATSRRESGGNGIKTSSLVAGGFSTANTTATEEFTAAGTPVTKTITTS